MVARGIPFYRRQPARPGACVGFLTTPRALWPGGQSSSLHQGGERISAEALQKPRRSFAIPIYCLIFTRVSSRTCLPKFGVPPWSISTLAYCSSGSVTGSFPWRPTICTSRPEKQWAALALNFQIAVCHGFRSVLRWRSISGPAFPSRNMTPSPQCQVGGRTNRSSMGRKFMITLNARSFSNLPGCRT